VKLYHIHIDTYSRSFLIQIFICAHTNTFSRGSSESTLDERYLFIIFSQNSPVQPFSREHSNVVSLHFP